MLTSGRCLPPHLPRPSSVPASSHGWMPVAGQTIEPLTPGRPIKVPMAGRSIKVSVTGPAIEVPTAGRTMGNGSYMGKTERIITAAKATVAVTVTVTVMVTVTVTGTSG